MISIKKYKNKYSNVWDNFIKNSTNGTIFHTQKFLSYHLQRRFSDHSLLFYSAKTLVAVLPAAAIVINNKLELRSHPGASYGGIIILKSLRFEEINNLICVLIDYCAKNQFASLRLIATPSVYLNNQNDIVEYALIWNNFYQSESYISHVTNLKNINSPLDVLDKRKKRYIQKMLKNQTFEIRNEKKIGVFYEILLASKKEFGIQPTHTKEELKKLLKLFPQKIILQLSYDQNKIVGGSLVFLTNRSAGLVFYNVVKKKYKKTQLSSLQLYYCIKLSIQKNLKYLDFGVSHLPQARNPLTPKFSLIRFKEQFGAIGIIRKIYSRNFDFEK